MWCLWNGEYGEHDLSYMPGVQGLINKQEKIYPNYIGLEIGDFVCTKVEYDWGRRDQRWTVQCKLCGEITYRYHTRDWRNGRGASRKCHCRKDAQLEEKRLKKEARKKELEEQKAIDAEQKIEEYLYKVYDEWMIISYDGSSKCTVVCLKCDNSREVVLKDLVNGKINPCTHKIPTDYSGDEWIGKRNGHLTAIGRDGSMFVARCDCGETINVRPVELFTHKTKRACGGANCEYSSVVWKEAQKRKKSGIAYEKEVEQMLLDKGYNAKATQGVGDYGVDIIITNDDGSTIAVQCKKQTKPAGVSAVQEVYAGGRYYDCTKFAVVCDTGFSDQAYYMARKLGVYLCDGDFDYPKDIEKYASKLLPTFKEYEKSEKYYEIDGEKKTLSEWCKEYGTNEKYVLGQYRHGVSFKEAVRMKPKRNTFTVNGFTGTLNEICDNFGMLRATVDYRMKQRGMTLEEALFTPKSNEM